MPSQNIDYYREIEFKSPEELMPNNIKVQILNSIKAKISGIMGQTMDSTILDALQSHLAIIEDAYNVSMYKFQFKLLTNIINQELSDIEDMIAFSQ